MGSTYTEAWFAQLQVNQQGLTTILQEYSINMQGGTSSPLTVFVEAYCNYMQTTNNTQIKTWREEHQLGQKTGLLYLSLTDIFNLESVIQLMKTSYTSLYLYLAGPDDADDIPA